MFKYLSKMLFMRNICVCFPPNPFFTNQKKEHPTAQMCTSHSAAVHRQSHNFRLTHSSSCLTLNFRTPGALNLSHDLVKTGHVIWGAKQASKSLRALGVISVAIATQDHISSSKAPSLHQQSRSVLGQLMPWASPLQL